MLRVFLVIDDYNELIYLQTLLKKLGMDVEGIQNAKKYNDVSLGFNPHILITTAHGKKVNGIELAKGVRRARGLPKIIALHTHEKRLTPEILEEAGIDDVLDSPINPKHLIAKMALHGHLDEVSLLDKYNKIKGLLHGGAQDENSVPLMTDENGQPIEDLNKVKSSLQVLQNKSVSAELLSPSNLQMDAQAKASAIGSQALKVDSESNSTQRNQRFELFVKSTQLQPGTSYNRQRIIDFNKMIRATSPAEDIAEIETERKDFVKFLFRAGKK